MDTKNKYLHYIILASAVSLVASCTQKKNNTTAADKLEKQDTAEIAPQKVDDHTAQPIPTKMSIKKGAQYVFNRNKNPYDQSYFKNPFDSAILVSGTFCELRGNHFHAGLDIRTGGQEGWRVLAAADGYVERVKVSTTGYGKVVYIRHPNGYTTVYGHLQQFTGTLADFVKEAQYKKRTFEVDLYPKKGELKIAQGQNFALSGNTGGSGGPHLHFEIRNPRGQSTNPLLHGLHVEDNLKPEIKRVSVYLRDNESLYTSGAYPYTTFSIWSDYLKNIRALKLAPGNYSFGLHTDDYFTDRKNVLGINYCWLTANGALLYEYQIEKFDFDQGRYIYTHTDPYLKWKENTTYFRLFKESYNPLPYYRQRQNGEIYLKHGDSVQMKLYIQDYVGLTDSAMWIMVGDTATVPLPAIKKMTRTEEHRVSGGETLRFHEWTIAIPKKAVYHPFDFKLHTNPTKPNMLSKTLQMHYGYTPLHTYINVSYEVPAKWLGYGEKLCVVSFDGKQTYYEGGSLEGNILHFKTRSLGEYAITYDHQIPKITATKLGRQFCFKVTDDLSGINQITCSINDKWILTEYEPKTNTLCGEIPAWIKTGTYELELSVTDHRNNKAIYQKAITL